MKVTKIKKPVGKPRGRPFTKGNAPVSPGRPKMSPEEKALATASRSLFRKTLRKYLKYNVDELKEIAKTKEASSIDMMVISVINTAIKNGDEKKLNYFIEQLFGKMKDVIEIDQVTIVKEDTDYSKLTNEEALTLKKLKEKIGS